MQSGNQIIDKDDFLKASYISDEELTNIKREEDVKNKSVILLDSNYIENIAKNDIPIVISDDFFRKTYIHPKIEFFLVSRFKINLLGLEPTSDKKFYINPIVGPVFPSDIPTLSDVEQSDLGNCAFLATLRSIVRRYPHFISSIISETNEGYVNVKLFIEQDDQAKQINYQIQKTIITPNDPNSFFNNINVFFKSLSNAKCEKNWVKLLEKALVAHRMLTADDALYYHLNSQRVNEKREDKLSTYEDVIWEIGAIQTCAALIGCKMTHDWLELNYKTGQAEKLKKELMNGEIITLSFKKNQYGFEDAHVYELVNYGSYEKEEFVLISNPWGFNKRKFFMDYKEPDISSLDMLIQCSIKDIKNDNSIIAVPIQIFNEIAYACKITTGVRERFAQPEVFEKFGLVKT